MSTTNKIYITATELSEMLGVSMAFSYKIRRTLNSQLKDMGFITISGVCLSVFSRKSGTA